MNLTKLILSLATVAATNILAINPVAAQEIDRELLCTKFPLNSECQDYRVAATEPKIKQLDRDRFCTDFPLNTKCANSAPQIIKLNLDRSGENDEWVKIEQQDNQLKLAHTTKVKDGLVSTIINGGLGAVPVPIPFEINKYDWSDHQVNKVAFKSDRCQDDTCTVAGKDTLVLPEGTDIYAGIFTINYQEKELKRSLSFRIPLDLEAETIDTIEVKVH